MLFLTGQEELAKQVFANVVRLIEESKAPEDARYLTAAARSYTYLERYKEASDLYLEAIAADPSFIDAHLGGGELFTEKYNYAEAADFFRMH
ncbi:MAG: hypothetical protein WKF84_06995 [Pyrinomonadaceae bacterium]